jgi:hypothetical protein
MKILCTLIILLAISTTLKAQVSEQEFQALKALYNATGGDNWTNRTGWENINTTATKDDVTTAWYGIQNISEGHVTYILFSANNLNGTLPGEIGNLGWLDQFYIYGNNLTGQLPNEMGNWTFLTTLDLSSNKLTGPLPTSLGNLSNLTLLNLTSNNINSPFPEDIIRKLTKLNSLYLGNCGFIGILPDLFDSLANLNNIELSSDKLEGELPPSFSRLKKIRSVHIEDNNFSGNLPTLDSCKILLDFYVNANHFSGSIPVTYSNLPSIRQLYLEGNDLSGIIQSSLFTVTLQQLNIRHNYFTFEGLEPVFTKLNTLYRKYYNTDKLFELKQNSLSVNKGEALTLNALTLSVYSLGGNNNRYKWFCNDVEVYSGNSPIHTIASTEIAHAGNYHFEVTNTVVTGVTLKSDNITVSVVGTNHPPTNIIISSSSVDENFTGLLGTLSATDPEAGDTHTFTLASGNGTNDRDNNRFSISGNQLNINNGANFETTTSLNVLISTNDGNGGIFTKAFVITINDVNEAPVYNGQVTSNTIDENSANGSTALTLMAQDPEGSPVIFSIIQGNTDGAFGIDGNKLVVADNTKFNYDVKNSYPLMVSASDGTLSSNAILTINLNKINSMPVVEDAVFTLDENSPVGTIVGSIAATDREGDPLTFSFLTGNELSAFSFTGNTISIANKDYIDFEQHPVFNLTINVSDGISNVQSTVTINLNNVVEPTDNAIATFLVSGMVGEPEIDYMAHTVRAYVSGVMLNFLIAEFELPSNATSNPMSGTTFDFTTPQTITVTSQSGDIQEWVVTVTFRVGNDELSNINVKVYPNPATDFLTISGLQKGSVIKLVTLSGSIVYNSVSDFNYEKIDIRKCRKGLYFVILENEKVTRKLLIE